MATRRGGRSAVWGACVLSAFVSSVVVLLVVASGALAVAKYPDRLIAGTGTSGSGVGELNGPRGVAVNDAGVADGSVDPQGVSTDGFVYVADMSNHRVQVFDANGDFRFVIGGGVAGGSGGEVCDLTELPCSPAVSGTGGGELSFPQGVAVNQQTGDVYVSEIGNRRVQQFAADGSLIRVWGWGVDDGSDAFQVCDAPADLPCQAGIAGPNGGQFATAPQATRLMDVAVSPTAPHHVFVGDPGAGGGDNGRIHEYTPDGSFVRLWGWDAVSTGQPGNVGTNAFEICASTAVGVCKRYVPGGQDGPLAGRFGTTGPGPIAVDGAANILYSTSSGPWAVQIQRFDLSQTLPASFLLPSFSFVGGLSGANALAIRPSTGNLLIGRSSSTVQEVDVSQSPPVEVERHMEGSGASLRGLTVSGDVFYLSTTSFGNRVLGADDGGAGQASMTVTQPVDNEGTTATFAGTVTPNGPEGFGTEYNFEYSRDGVNWITVPGSENPLGDGTDPVAVSDDVTGLEPASMYQLRLRTRKAFGNPVFLTAPVPFETEAIPPTADTLPPQARGQVSATITGSVNPNNSPTSFYFEWGTDTSYGNLAPIPAGSAGDGFGQQIVSAQLEGLSPDTTYHYRVVADNGIETAPGQTEVRGDDITFTTRPASPAGADRAFELVSPADKYGGQGVGFWPNGLGHLASSGVAAHKGDRFIASGLYGSVLTGDAGFGLNTDMVFAERVDDQQGWQSRPAMTRPNYAPVIGQTAEIIGAAADLSRLFWGSPSTLALFPELVGAPCGAGQPRWSGFNAGLLSDWGGPLNGATRWELFGPRDLCAGSVVPASEMTSGALWTMAISGNGSSAYGMTELSSAGRPVVHGLAGEDDPTGLSDDPGDPSPPLKDLVSGRSIYGADLSGGLSDSFSGVGGRELVNVCTGAAGPARTTIPSVGGGGELTAAECGAGVGGRDRLVSDRGASFSFDAGARDGVVSDDGSRVFFLAPDPKATGVPNGTSSFCSGSGDATLCPPQLFVRQRNPDGSVVTRWVSKAADGLFGLQQASLTGSVRFEGASADGGRVYFRSNSPLTVDDPNGPGAPTAGGVKTGSPHANSWDLYMFELADGPDPTGAGSSLTRVSAGPDGDGNCNSPRPSPSGGSDTDDVAALRFVSDDGTRAYFTCQAPLPNVPASADESRVTTPAGTVTLTTFTNLYLFDANRPQAQRWRFVARLPRASGSGLAVCASTGVARRSPVRASNGYHPAISDNTGGSNCVRGSGDGTFVTLFTPGRLTVDDDPGGGSVGDIYGYDAVSDELVRITSPQGGSEASYPCLSDDPDTAEDEGLIYACRGDGGIDSHIAAGGIGFLGVVVDSLVAGSRVAFFESASRLVAGDLDDGYDVYVWRDGELSLVTSGDPDSDHAFYKGNDRTGRNLYVTTRDRLSWQDTDAVADVYSARVGGGIPEPEPPVVCLVLSGGCQGAGVALSGPAVDSLGAGSGDAVAVKAPVLKVSRPGAGALRRAARSGVVRLRVRVGRAGVVRGVARARVSGRVRKVGSGRVRALRAGSVVLRLRLSRPALRQLAAGRRLGLAVRVSAPGAGSRLVRFGLRRADR